MGNENDNSKAHKGSSEASHTHEKIVSNMYRSVQSVLFECSNVNTEGNGGIVNLGVYIMRVLICSGGNGRFGLMGISCLMMGYCADGTSEGNWFTC